MRFTDKVALITAAGNGIGRATAGIIGSEGGIVVAVDNDKGRVEAAWRLTCITGLKGGELEAALQECFAKRPAMKWMSVLTAAGIGAQQLVSATGAPERALGRRPWW